MTSIEEELSDVDESTIPYETAFAGFLTTEAKLVDASLSEVAIENSRNGPPISEIMGPYNAPPGLALSTSGQVYTITPGELHRLQGAAKKLEDEVEGYLLIDISSRYNDVYFFPKKTFDETFIAPTDPKITLKVQIKPDHPHKHRIDSFLCNHSFMHAKSIWWWNDKITVLSTYYIIRDEFLCS